MRHVAALAVALCLPGIAASCGGDEDYTATSADAADLHVVQVTDESAGLYAEGALSYVRIEAAGDEVLEVELPSTSAGKETTIRLDPGRYTLVSWQRPCDGNCDSLDPPTDLCEEQFVISPTTPVEAAIALHPGEGCTVAFE